MLSRFNTEANKARKTPNFGLSPRAKMRDPFKKILHDVATPGENDQNLC